MSLTYSLDTQPSGLIKLILFHTSFILLQRPEGYGSHVLTAKAEVLACRHELGNALQVAASNTPSDILLVKAGGMVCRHQRSERQFPYFPFLVGRCPVTVKAEKNWNSYVVYHTQRD